MARALRRTLRYGRDQQHLLSPSRRDDLRRLGTPRPARLRLRRQGEPVPDAHEEAEGSRGAATAVLLAGDATRADVRSGPLPAAAALACEPRTVRAFPQSAAAPAPARDRVSRAELVQRRCVRADAEASRGALSSRHGRVRERPSRHRTVRVRAVPRRPEVLRQLQRRRARRVGVVARRTGEARRADLRVLQQRHRRTRAARCGSLARTARAAHIVLTRGTPHLLLTVAGPHIRSGCARGFVHCSRGSAPARLTRAFALARAAGAALARIQNRTSPITTLPTLARSRRSARARPFCHSCPYNASMSKSDRIAAWMRRQMTAAGARGFIVGLSGGVDSAVVARLSQLAAPGNVIAAILPCHSDPQDEYDAALVARHFSLATR